jgi:hypothetical protein
MEGCCHAVGRPDRRRLGTGLTLMRLEEPGDDDYPMLIALQLTK